MDRMKKLTALPLLLVLAAAYPAAGQGQNNYNGCGDYSLGPNQQIERCTVLFGTYGWGASSIIVRANSLLMRGTAYARKGDLESAQADYRRAIELDTTSISRGGRPQVLAVPYNNRCWIRAAGNFELDQALADCNKALELTPGSPMILDTRGFLYLRMDRTDDAMKDYDAVLAKQPNSWPSLFGRGVAKLRKNNVEGATADLFRAEKLKPGTRAEFEAYGLTK